MGVRSRESKRMYLMESPILACSNLAGWSRSYGKEIRGNAPEIQMCF
jgi:hypothetical protein